MSRSIVGRPVKTASSHSQFTNSSRMGDNSVKQLQGSYVESQVRRAILSLKKVTPVLMSNQQLKTVASQRPLKFQSVSHYLQLEDYGTWDTAHPNTLLDKFYKCDMVVQYKGWTIGIDVTTDSNPLTINKKRSSMTNMKGLYSSLEIDKVAILVTKETDPSKFISVLDNIIKSNDPVSVFHI